MRPPSPRSGPGPRPGSRRRGIAGRDATGLDRGRTTRVRPQGRIRARRKRTPPLGSHVLLHRQSRGRGARSLGPARSPPPPTASRYRATARPAPRGASSPARGRRSARALRSHPGRPGSRLGGGSPSPRAPRRRRAARSQRPAGVPRRARAARGEPSSGRSPDAPPGCRPTAGSRRRSASPPRPVRTTPGSSRCRT